MPLKYDGANLGILSALFDVVEVGKITGWIASKPTGKYARKIWFLYEFLTGRKLPLPDLNQGNYVLLLEPDRYYTVVPGRRMQRQRVVDNLLGGRSFCPSFGAREKLATLESEEAETKKALRRTRQLPSSRASKAGIELSL